MCQTHVISNHLERISRHSFDSRMRIVSQLYVEKQGEIARLLNEVDALSERLHDEFQTITEEYYRIFGSYLKIVIATLKSLLRESITCRELKPYNERMREQILELEELNHDILEFRMKAPKDEALQQTMAGIYELDFSYFYQVGHGNPFCQHR